MGGGGSQADQVKESASSDRDYIGVPVDVITVDMRLNIRNMKIGVLGPLAPFEDHGRTDQQKPRTVAEITFDFAGELRLGPIEGLIDDHQDFRHHRSIAIEHHIAEQRIARAKHIARKIDPMPETDLYSALDTGHLSNLYLR